MFEALKAVERPFESLRKAFTAHCLLLTQFVEAH